MLCEGWECIDIRGDPPREVFEWLASMNAHHLQVDEIQTKNLLEHLKDPGRFIKSCFSILRTGGSVSLVTDNAEFLPFYFPFWIRRTGIGAHSLNKYAIDHCNSVHYMIFTGMHLKNLFMDAGFVGVRVQRITLGARLKVTAHA